MGRIRGLLCWTCNTGLGAFGDNPEIMERAINYINSDTNFGKVVQRNVS